MRRAPATLLGSIRRIASSLPSPVRIMEVCGTHTMALHKSGLKPQLAEAGVEMISGPGCPVCITPDGIHEAAIDLVTGRPDTILATFGDMTRVPTRKGSLQTAVPAGGSAVRVIYSPEEALEAARCSPGKDVVLFGAGFETTTPAVAFAIQAAHAERLGNFSVLPALWLIPPAVRAVLEAGEISVSGFLYPGHVSAVIGEVPYAFIPREFGIPGAITGFEPEDILIGVLSVLDQTVKGTPKVANMYARVVRHQGNPTARALMNETLEPRDAAWRGLGVIPRSGLGLRAKFRGLDAVRRYGLETERAAREPRGCLCGRVLRGVARPEDCRLFGAKCSPESPVGPCMVSHEGACLVSYKYSRRRP